MKFPSTFYDASLRYAKFGEVDTSLTAYQQRVLKKLNLEEENDVLYLNNKPIVRDEEKFQVLNDIYIDPKQGLCGYHLLYSRIKEQYANISRLDVQQFLKANRSHQQWLVPKKKRVIVRPILTKRPKERFVTDIFYRINNHSIPFFRSRLMLSRACSRQSICVSKVAIETPSVQSSLKRALPTTLAQIFIASSTTNSPCNWMACCLVMLVQTRRIQIKFFCYFS